MARAGLQIPVPSPRRGTVSCAMLTSYVAPACPFRLALLRRLSWTEPVSTPLQNALDWDYARKSRSHKYN